LLPRAKNLAENRSRVTTESSSGPSGRSSRAAFWVGAGIFLSRIAGFARTALVSRIFGTGGVVDVWGLAMRVPNVIQNLLGEGTLSASMIPVYSEMLEEGREEEAGRFVGAALGIVTVVAWSIALLGVLAAPLLAKLFPGLEPWQHELLTTLLRILFPMVAFMAMSAWALTILNSHRRFFVSYFAPVLWNLSMITTLLVFGFWMGWGAADREGDLLVMLSLGALGGGVLQLLVQIPWIRPVLGHFRLSVSTKVAGMSEAIRNFLPIVSARGVTSLSGFIDFWIAGLLTSGGVSLLLFAQRLYLLPISLFGLSVAAAELPELSRQRKAGSAALAERVGNGLERVAFFVIPVACAYVVFGDLVVGTLYQGGKFGADSTAAVYLVLAAYALGLPASASSRLLSSAYFAVRDTRTPALFSVVRMVLSVAVGVALMIPLDGFGVGGLRLGAVGLALGATVAAWTEYAVLRHKLRAHIGPHGPRSGRVPRILAASLLGALAAVGAKSLLGSTFPAHSGWVESWLGGSVPGLVLPLLLLGTALAFGVIWFASASLMGVGGPLRSFLKRG
jgi:putative peptidoglycan lipid II flippase